MNRSVEFQKHMFMSSLILELLELQHIKNHIFEC